MRSTRCGPSLAAWTVAHPGTTQETHMVDPPSDSDTGTPRWVKLSAIVAVVVIVLVGIMLLAGGGPGGHGPGRHSPSGDPGDRTAPTAVTPTSGAADHTAPAGGHGP